VLENAQVHVVFFLKFAIGSGRTSPLKMKEKQENFSKYRKIDGKNYLSGDSLRRIESLKNSESSTICRMGNCVLRAAFPDFFCRSQELSCGDKIEGRSR
jgi:hypothetical protein